MAATLSDRLSEISIREWARGGPLQPFDLLGPVVLEMSEVCHRKEEVLRVLWERLYFW